MEWIPDPAGSSGLIVKKSGSTIGTRRGLNLIPGTGITLTVSDDATNDDVDVTVASTGGAGTAVIDEVALASDGAISFPSIPTTFRDLLLVGRIRSNRSDPFDEIGLRVGETSVDTGSNYRYISDRAGTASGEIHAASATSIRVGNIPADSDTDAEAFAAFQVWILNYDTTGYYRHMIFRCGYYGGSGRWTTSGEGQWLNTADPVDVVALIPLAGGTNWTAGSAARLYGFQ